MSEPKKDDGPILAYDENFQGPPMQSEFSNWKPEQVQAADGILKKLDGMQLYKSAAGAGLGHEHAKDYAELMSKGGLSRESATKMARYRMWRENRAVPTGERAPDDTPEQIDARRDAFLSGSKEDRAKLVDESKKRNATSREGFYDALIGQPPKPKEQPPQQPMSQIGPEMAPPSLSPEQKAAWAEHANKIKGAT